MHEINIKENMYNHFCNHNQLDYNIFSKLRFNRVYSSWLKNKDKLLEVFKNNNIPVSHEKDAEVAVNDRENVNIVYIAKMFVELYSVEKDQCIDSFISGSPNGRLDEMMDNFAKKHNGEIFHDENGSPMERAYFASKTGADLKTYDENMDSYVVQVLKSIPSSVIDTIIRKHFVAIHNMFLEHGGYASSDYEKLDIRDLDSFMEAYEGNTMRTQEVRVMAARALAHFLSDRRYSYDDKDLTDEIVSMGDLPENVAGELDLNIGYRLRDVAYSEKHGRKNELNYFKDIKAHAGELAKVWDAEDIDRYEAIRSHFLKRMDEVDAKAGGIDEEELSDIRSRIHSIAEMSIEEVIKNAENLKDEMQDVCLSCEIIIRQSLLNRLDVVDPSKAQSYTFVDPSGDETILDCVYVDDPDQVGLSLVSFFSINRLMPERLGPGVTEERLQKLKELEARSRENNGEEHLCVQLFNYKRAAEASNRYGSICYIYDRTSLTPEEILVMSDDLLESNVGLYSSSFSREMGGYSRFSKSAEDIVRSTERDQIRYVGSEIDIEKGDKAVAIGVLYTPDRYSKKELEKIAELARTTNRPLIIYDVFEIQKKIAAKKNKTKDNDMDR